jgi:hypothetical protein
VVALVQGLGSWLLFIGHDGHSSPAVGASEIPLCFLMPCTLFLVFSLLILIVVSGSSSLDSSAPSEGMHSEADPEMMSAMAAARHQLHKGPDESTGGTLQLWIVKEDI